MTAPEKLTVTIPVPAAWHTIIGICLAATAATVFIIHSQLPGGSHHRSTTATVSIVAACTTMAYWLWCVLQGIRSSQKSLVEAIAEARGEAQQRQERVLAAFEEIGNRLSELSEEIGENRGAIKDLADRLEEVVRAVEELAGAVEALQDLYMKDGHPEEPPGEPE
jgi:type I site-specific restriction endonuclease